MIQNLKLIKHHEQLKELSSYLKYCILKELIAAPATCQQLAVQFNESKQKVHYNLSQMIRQELIEIVENPHGNNREVFYRATARNYVLDLAIGLDQQDQILNHRGIIGKILEQEHQISLAGIAARLLDQSLNLRAGNRLLIVSGKFNFPLVEKLLLEAASRGILTTLIYQDLDQIKAKNELFSLEAYQADYEEFNRILKDTDVYLNLNGEARMVELSNPDKISLRNRMLEEGRRIIQEHQIKIAMMPAVLQDTLSNKSIESELQFWKALDVDYNELGKNTIEMCKKFSGQDRLELKTKHDTLQFGISRIVAECGSFGTSSFQSPVINLPGGEVLIIPKPESVNGRVSADRAFALGEEIIKPVLEFKHNEISTFSAEKGQRTLAKVIAQGGLDGRKVSLICIGTNEHLKGKAIDLALKHKSQGMLTLFWGDNRPLGGNVCGNQEWFVQIEKPILSFDK